MEEPWQLLALGGSFLMESLCHLLRLWAKLQTGEMLCWHSKPKHQIYSCLLNLKMNVCPFEAKWWWGVGDFFESVEKHMLSLSAQGWDWLVWFHLLKSSEIVLHLWNLNGLRCKGAELCSGQFSSMKCILWTQQTAPAPWETAKSGEIIFLSKVLCKKEKSQLNTLFFLKSSKRNGCATIFYEKIKSQRQCSYD